MLFAKYNTKRALHAVSPDISKLLYIKDSHKKMCSEPSTIYLDLPTKHVDDYDDPPYFPNYLEFDENLRWHYLYSLQYLLEGTQDIGYVFLYYYGLERQLLEGDFESAYNMIMRLREAYSNNSFLMYSGRAIVLTCMKKQKMRHLERFITSKRVDHHLGIDVDLYLLSKTISGMNFTASDIYEYRTSFGYTSKKYAIMYPKMFTEYLEVALTEIIQNTEFDTSELLDVVFNIQTIEMRPYANKSLWHISAEVPILHEYPFLYSCCKQALDIAHERSKEYCKFFY